MANQTKKIMHVAFTREQRPVQDAHLLAQKRKVQAKTGRLATLITVGGNRTSHWFSVPLVQLVVYLNGPKVSSSMLIILNLLLNLLFVYRGQVLEKKEEALLAAQVCLSLFCLVLGIL